MTHISETIAHEVATRLLPWIHEAWQSDPKTHSDIVRVVADEYRDRLDQLEAENAKLRRQVHLVGLCDAYRFNRDFDCWECHICDAHAKVKDAINHHPDCPHAEEIK